MDDYIIFLRACLAKELMTKLEISESDLNIIDVKIEETVKGTLSKQLDTNRKDLEYNTPYFVISHSF